MLILVAILGFILIGISLYIAISTSLLYIVFGSQAKSCTSPVDPDGYSDLGVYDGAIANDFRDKILAWGVTFSISIILSSCLLIFVFVDHGLMVVRKYIIVLSSIGAIVLISLEAILIDLANSITQLSEIMNSGEETT